MLITDKSALCAYNTENRIWQGIPGIEVTPGGRIFATFYSGGIKEDLGNYSILVKSDDGINFSEPIAVAYAGEKHRCYDQCLWIDPLGRLWFIWSRMPEHAVFAAICNDPDADELTWSEEFEIGKEVMMNKPTVLSTGEWLFPIAVWNDGVRALGAEYDTKQKKKGSFVYKTVDNGNTFERIGGADVPNRSFDEHMVLELSDGVLAMYVRANYGIGVSYSYDRGRTWTKGVDSGLSGPCSRFFIRRLKSGRVLLVNHVNFTGRNNLTALLSEDDGKTWKYKLLLDGRNSVAYPDGVEADDGYIYITYDRERGGFKSTLDDAYADAREILYCKITEEDIIAGEVKDSGSKLGVVISKLGKYSGEKDNPFKEFKRFSKDGLASYLAKKNKNEIIAYLFENYNINCMNMHKLDSTKLDKLIENLSTKSYDTEKTVLEIINLVSSVTENKREDIPVVKRVKEIIAENLSEDVSTSVIADKIGISLHYMCHLFKKETGITVTEYKNSVKIAEAKRLLVTTCDKITDISMKCGYGSVSYFTKIFTASEKVSPAQYRRLLKNSGKKDADVILCSMLPKIGLLDGLDADMLTIRQDIPMYKVTMPDEEYGFLHEAVIIAFKDKLFAAWYNNEKTELLGTTPIRFATSEDQGKTWSTPVTVAVDKTGEIMYCPPVFAIEDGKLYMFLNQMVKADHMHSFDLYIYNEEKNQFEELWSRPIPFKLNTNVYKLSNGKLIHPGRISHELDTFPNTPAVMISDNGRVDTEWRLVKFAENGNLPDGARYVHPELSLVECGGKIYGFCRNDGRDVPVVYISEDAGESWSQPYAHDLPMSPSKIYSGTLSDGRNYVVGNIHFDYADRYKRNKLAIFFSRKGEMKFDKGFILQDGKRDESEFSGTWHYPCCCEHDGRLYVIYSANTGDGNTRGAVVSVIDLNEI